MGIIIKYSEFIKEELEVAESYIEEALAELKRKIDKIFERGVGNSQEKEISIDDVKLKEKNKSLVDLGLTLSSSELSLKNLSLKVIFNDDKNRYDLYISIDISEGKPKEQKNDFSASDVKKCKIKFRKYDLETLSPTPNIYNEDVEISDIDEDFLIKLKIECDDKYPDSDEDEFKIVT